LPIGSNVLQDAPIFKGAAALDVSGNAADMDLASHLRTYAATKGFDALDVRSTWAVHSLIVPYLQKSSEQPVHLAIVLNGRMADRVSYHFIYQHTYILTQLCLRKYVHDLNRFSNAY